MGWFTGGKPQQAAGAARPGTVPPMGSGRRLRSKLSPVDCAEVLRQVFGAYRQQRYPELPLLVPAGARWTPGECAPSLVLSGNDDSDKFLLITLAGTHSGTEAGIFPLDSGEDRLNLSVVGHWKQRDNSLASVGTWPPRTVSLAPPPVDDGLIDSTLQAGGYPLTTVNRAKMAQQFTVMFLVKCQGFVSLKEGSRGEERFLATHEQRADRTTLTGPLRSALQLLTEWNSGVLPYVQDLPLRCRAILLEGVGDEGTMWSDLER